MSRRVVTLLVLALAALFGVLRANRSHDVPGDFLRYHRAGRLVATGQAERIYDVALLAEQSVYAAERSEEATERGDDADDYVEAEFKYAPAMAVLMAPLGALHPRTANLLWSAWNAALLAGLVLVAWRLVATGGVRGTWLLIPLVVLWRTLNDNHNLGQLNPSAIVPAALGLVLLSRSRGRTLHQVGAGALVAWGAVVKYMPVFLLPWLVWKRAWRALGATLLGIMALFWALPAAVLGPGRATELIAEWVAVRSHHYTSAVSPDLPGHSIKSFLYRVFGETPWMTGHGDRTVELDVSVTHLPPETLKWGTLLVSAVVLVVVLRACGRRQRDSAQQGAALEHGLILATLLLVSPEARTPHFLYALLLAFAVVAGLVRARADSAFPRARLRAAFALTIVWALLQNLDSSKLGAFGHHANAFCAMGWGTAALMVAGVLLLPRAQTPV